jgi:multidrug efflux pump subunit AcrA (membrane-fusion protein)
MDLVRKARAGEEVEITEDLSRLLKSPNETVVASIKTIRGEYKSMPLFVEAQGVVTYDTRHIHTIPARVGGRLERVYLTYAFQRVSKGQKIADIYSPELITAQRELIFLLENDPANHSLIDAARKKLELLGMSSAQIDLIIRREETQNTISVYSPHSGYMITGELAPSAPVTASGRASGTGMGDGMSSSPSASTQTTSQPLDNGNTATILREGDYVAPGQTLLTVASDNALRIELNVSGIYTGTIIEGSKVELNFGDSTQTATVDFVQPFFDKGEEFIKIRVYTNKRKGLHIGHLASAKISLGSRESLWVPREAVLDLGTQKIVFLKVRGTLKPKAVTTGLTAEGMIEINGGLASSEEIATNAQYLIDSESFIKPVN